MTVNDVFKYNGIIKNIIDNGVDITPLVKFKLLGMLKQFEPVLDNFEKIRNEQIYKYGKQDSDGNYGIFLPKKEDFEDEKKYQDAVAEYETIVKKINDELESIAKSEADFELQKFNYADIVDSGLSADYLLELYDLIEE